MFPKNPHFFKVLVAGFNNGLKIPEYFSRAVMRINEHSQFQAVFKMRGKEWIVDVDKEKFQGPGWIKFIRDNDMKLSDFIVFKFLNPSLFEVWVFDGRSEMGKLRAGSEVQNVQMANPRYDPSTSNAFTETLALPNVDEVEGMVELPCFVGTMNCLNENGCLLYFPLEFAQYNGLLVQDGDIFVKTEQGNFWNFQLKKSKEKHVYLAPCSRFGEFVTMIGLKKGDSFKLEVLSDVNSTETPTVRIKPWRSMENEGVYARNEPAVEDNRKKEDLGKKVVVMESDCDRLGKKVVVAESDWDRFPYDYTPLSVAAGVKGDFVRGNVSSGCHDFPFFTFTVKRYCFTINCLNIPLHFAREHGLTSDRDMALVDSLDRIWNASLVKFGESNIRIVNGWKEFRDAHCLEEGDNLLFELVENGAHPVARLTLLKA